MKNMRVRPLATLVALMVSTLSLLAVQTSIVVRVTSTASGFYDANGENHPLDSQSLAGLDAAEPGRGLLRNFITFKIPPFVGTLTNARLTGLARVTSPGYIGETLGLFAVTNSPARVVQGGLNETNIYRDLGTGPSYGEVTLSAGWHQANFSLTSQAVADITARRGSEWVLGGALMSHSGDDQLHEFIDFPNSGTLATLILEISGPAEPTILMPPNVEGLTFYSNWMGSFSVAASGVPPLHYTWFVNGEAQPTQEGYSTFTLQDWQVNPLPISVVVSNAFGSATSATVFVEREPIYFQVVRTNMTLRAGSSFYFTPPASYSYSLPTSFRWLKDGLPTSIDTRHLYITAATTADSGDYTLVASNAVGLIASPVIRLQFVETAPVFWRHPRDVERSAGSSFYLSAQTVGWPPPDQRWYFNNTFLETSRTNHYPSLFLHEVTASDSGSYYVVASNGLGSVTSAVAMVVVNEAPAAIVAEPQDVLMFPHQTRFLFVGISGYPTPTVQWYRNGQPVPYYGQQQSLLLTNAPGSYFAVVSNASGVVTSRVATVTIYEGPPLLSGPQDVAVRAGNGVYLSVTVSNYSPDLHYQWQFNGANVASTTEPTYFLPVVDHGNAGEYRVIVSNSYGSSTSRVAIVTITEQAPVFIINPAPIAALEGSFVGLSFSADGAPPARYYLHKDGAFTGLTGVSPFFSLGRVTAADAGEYVVLASNRVGVATSQVARVTVVPAGPLDRWTQRNPLPQGHQLHDIAWGGGQFVAVGEGGALVRSRDGIHWAAEHYRTQQDLNAVAYGNGVFVAVGESGLILVSSNGLRWSTHAAGTAELRGVAFGNGTFVAVSANNAVFASTNGVDWVQQGGLIGSLRSGAFGNGQFLFASGSGSVGVTADLQQWTYTALFGGIEGVSYGNGRFLVLGNDGRIASSTDGVNWTLTTNGTRRLYDSAYGNTVYVAVGSRGTILNSGDALTWTPAVSPTEDRLEGITVGAGLFVAVGENGTIVTSTNGSDWVVRTRGSTSDLDGLAVNDQLAVAVGKDGTILTSPDGTHWTRRVTPGAQNNWHGVAYGNGQWVVVGEGTNVLVSANAIDWEAHPHGMTNTELKSVLYANGRWVTVGTFGHIATSPNAVEWTQQQTPDPYDLNDVAYGNGMFVVVGDRWNPNATVFVSTNGVNWLDYSYLAASKNARAVTFADGKFLVALNDGRLLMTTNPTIYSGWQPVSSGVAGDGRNLRGVTHSNGFWAVVGNNGIVLTSTNGAYWQQRGVHTTENLHAVRLFNNTFLAVGNRGTILQSDPLVPSLGAFRLANQVKLRFSAPRTGVFQLQHTTDFNWTDLRLITNATGAVDVDLPATDGHRFFRVIPAE